MKIDMNKFNHRKSTVWQKLRKKQSEVETTKIYTDEELEAMADEAGNHAGIMRLHTAELHLPKSLEEPEDGRKTDGAFRVMLVIIILFLIFIGVIAYFVAQMPDKV